MTAQTSPRPVPERASLRCCAARALIELGSLTGAQRPVELELLARAYPLEPGTWRTVLAAQAHPKTAQDTALLAMFDRAQLGIVELLAIALLVAVEDEPLFARATAALQAPVHGTRPTLGLLAAACAPLADSQSATFHALLTGHARGFGILTLHDPHLPLAEQTVSISNAPFMALHNADDAIPGVTVDPRERVALSPAIERECVRLANVLGDHHRALNIRTTSPAEGRAICAAIAAARGARIAFVDGTPPPGLGIYLALRKLMPAYVVDVGPGERAKVTAPPGYGDPLVVVSGREGSIEVNGSTIPSWQVPIPPRDERALLWRAALGDSELADQMSEHRHGIGRIAHLSRSAQRLAELDGCKPAREHFRTAAWVSEGVGLGGLAEPIHDDIPDDAMVTTAQLQRDLDLLLLRCKHREALGGDLGSAIKSRRRQGVRAMFVGPSGTGKTLAASWLATKLGLPLYRVDLASVTSKYIGETEKNLAQLLARAEHEELILLFDEADSMFGKRTDVKEANDRFANAQTNFLLQRIESFDGIVVLTSNSKTRLDPAFTRRLDTIIDFPLPGPEERRALWLAHLGDSHSLDPAAINRLAASVDLVGGHIRNAVLSAAVLARRDRRQVSFEDVVTGLLVEYRKLGRSVPPTLQEPA
jgi:hypothetical protein